MSSLRLLRGFVLVNLAMVLVNGGAYAYQLLASRGLSVAGYGLWGAFLSSYLIVSVPGLTINLVVARRVAELSAHDARAIHVYTLAMGRRLAFYLAGGLLVLLALALFVHLLAPSYQLAAPLALGVAVIMNLAFMLPLGILQGLHEFGRYSLILAIRSVLTLALGALLLVLGTGLSGVLAGLALGSAGGILVGVLLVKTLMGREGRTVASSSQVSAGAVAENYLLVTIAYTFTTLMLYLDTLFAQRFLVGEEAGHYAAVAVAARIIYYAPYAVITIVVPRVAMRTAIGRDTRPLLVGGFLLTLATTLPFVAIYAAAPRLLLRLLYGQTYAASPVADLLPRYAGAVALLTLSYFLVHYFMACRRLIYLVALAAGLATLGLSLALGHARAADLVRAILLGNGVAATLLIGLAITVSLRWTEGQVRSGAAAAPVAPAAGWEGRQRAKG